MAETILSSFILALAAFGSTMNLLNYEVPYIRSIFNNSQIVETPVNVWDARYHVIQDGNIPFSALGTPVDYVFQNRLAYFTSLGPLWRMTTESFKGVPIIFMSEYRTKDRSLKEDAKPIPGWRSIIDSRSGNGSTHYVHTKHCGARFFTLVIFSSSVDGDIQVMRRILTDVMGTSGRIGADLVDLFRKAEKAVRESEEVRGQVYVSTGVRISSSTNLPFMFQNTEDMLEKMSEFPKYVLPETPGKDCNPALFESLRPLHDLDAHYKALQKNTLVERYMAELLQKYNDVELAYKQLNFLGRRIFSWNMKEEDVKAYNAYIKKLETLEKALSKVFIIGASAYKNMDVQVFKSALELYKSGLDNTTENYFADFLRFYEKTVMTCKNDFLKPVRGSLIVNKNEVVKKGKTGSVTQCQDLCLEDKRCRAVGYVENTTECLIYYRSTRSARILFPQTDGKVYDRSCTNIVY